MTELKSLIEFASDQAEKFFRRQGVIYPMFHAIKTSGETMLVPSFAPDKDASVALTKALFTLEDIDRYVFMDEAWILDNRTNNLPPLDMEKIRREGLRDHPDRREIVMFSAENRRGEMQTASRFILRPEIGRPSLAPLKIDDMTAVTGSSGRMVGLLKLEKR